MTRLGQRYIGGCEPRILRKLGNGSGDRGRGWIIDVLALFEDRQDDAAAGALQRCGKRAVLFRARRGAEVDIEEDISGPGGNQPVDDLRVH